MNNGNRNPRFALSFAVCLAAAAVSRAAGLDPKSIEILTGAKGTLNPEGNVFKVSLPRTDVTVKVDGEPVVPFRGLAGWAAFTALEDDRYMVMGDNALFEDEVNPVIDEVLAVGLEVTALHNHFFYDEPHVYYMHVSGVGKQEELAEAVGRISARIKAVRAARPRPAASFGPPVPVSQSAISRAPIETLLGMKGEEQNGMLKVVWARHTTMQGMDMGSTMGVNTWAAFAGTDESAVVDGDFAMPEGGVQGVIKALRKGGINVVALHQHMLGESPRIMFLHFWGRGTAITLAQTLKEAVAADVAPAPAKEMPMKK